jgi:hypothetical protein
MLRTVFLFFLRRSWKLGDLFRVDVHDQNDEGCLSLGAGLWRGQLVGICCKQKVSVSSL